MRLDKYLKISRIIKRRTIANEAADTGRISINGKVSKPSAEVKPGDIIEIRFGTRILKVRVNDVSDYAKKEDASSMYTLVSEERIVFDDKID